MSRGSRSLLNLLLFAGLSHACATAAPTTKPAPAAHDAAASFTWHAWTPASFATAQRERRILLVNVAASWCHWCHVMDHETYADAEVAALLRDHFMPIRVDSDARPDLAERYSDWGWPATAVLTSDARPVLELRGYQDPREFAALLRGLVADRDAGKLQGRRPAPPAPVRDADLVALRQAAYKQLDGLYHEEIGGWGRKQKYPLAALDELALLRAQVFGEKQWHERALTTLGNEVKLIDPVWGGMYQYSVGGTWDDPHFEKIGAIQAGALEALALAYRRTGDARWRAAAHLQRSYLLDRMQHPQGGFYTSQDADLQRPGQPPVLGADYYALDDAGRRKLGVPRVDENRYADLNGRTIVALCRLYAAVPGPDGKDDVAALAAAQTAAEHLLRAHRAASGGFKHAAEDTGLLYLRDQAAVGRALLALYRVTGDARWLDEARSLAKFMLEALADRERGGFFAHTLDPNAVGVFAERRKPLEENALAARFMLELHRQVDHLPDPGPHGDAAIATLRAVSDPSRVREEGRMIGQYALALAEASFTPVDVTVVGKQGDPTVVALHRAALALDDPRTLLNISPPGARYPDIGAPAVYLCTDNSCSSPIKDVAKLPAAAAKFLATVP
ncbi:MAG TPA: DUF255 domain-containing protein [Nannocystis sp.]|jgi:hypothetical protein